MSTGVTIWEAAGANGGVKADLGQLMQLVGEGEVRVSGLRCRDIAPELVVSA